jgi:hypothetical protein
MFLTAARPEQATATPGDIDKVPRAPSVSQTTDPSRHAAVTAWVQQIQKPPQLPSDSGDRDRDLGAKKKVSIRIRIQCFGA